MSEIRYIKEKKAIIQVEPSDLTVHDKILWNSYMGLRIKVNVKYELPDQIAIEFLTPTSVCGIGYYKWYYKDHFNSVFEFIE